MASLDGSGIGGLNGPSGWGSLGGGWSVQGVAGVASDLGGAAQDLASMAGDYSAEGNYKTAEGIANQDVRLEETATAIKEAQQQRQFEQTLGTQAAQVAGNGFGGSGSALDILRSSVQQGALAHATIATQGMINESSYQQQANAYGGEANAARSAADAAMLGGVLKLGEAAASIAFMAIPK